MKSSSISIRTKSFVAPLYRKGIKNAEIIEIPEADVIAEGLIKKMLIINEDFPQQVEMENATSYLLKQAYAKQREIR